MEEPLKLPTGDLSRTPKKALSILDTHFPGGRIKKGPEIVDQPGKIRDNGEDWKKTEQVVIDDRIRWAVNTFMPYKAPDPDGIYPICLQKRLGTRIKYPIDVFLKLGTNLRTKLFLYSLCMVHIWFLHITSFSRT